MVIYYNNELVNKLRKKIPENISKLNIRFNEQVHGHIRFNKDKLKSVYLKANVLDSNPYFNLVNFYETDGILKYNYIDGEYIFKDLYLLYKSDLSKIYNYKYQFFPSSTTFEHRFDSDLNINAKYDFLPCKSGGFCTQYEKNGKPVNHTYIEVKEKTDFSNYMEYLMSNNIIVNNKEDNINALDGYFMREDNKEDIYISFSAKTKKFLIEHIPNFHNQYSD